MSTPVKGNSSIEGRVCNAISAASANSECVGWSSYAVTAVFTVDEYAGEGQQQHRRKGLQRDQRRQRYLRMCGLQDVPDHGGGVHAAADHGNEIGCEDQPHPTVLEHLPHIFNCKPVAARYNDPI